MKVGAIIQARLSSTRLPEKVLKELPPGSGVTALEHVVNRVMRSRMVNTVVIATTDSPEDVRIAMMAERLGVPCYRGSKDDVLSRYYHAAEENGLDVIVRITSDCPCIDPEVIDVLIGMHFDNRNGFTTNALERSFPTGIDVEVFDFGGLEKAHRIATKPFEREHVTPFFYMNEEAGFKVQNLVAGPGAYAPDVRITLDTVEDYCLLCILFDHFSGRDFRTQDIVGIFEAKPWLKLVNGRIVQKKVYADASEELRDAVALLRFQGMETAAGILEKA